MGLLWACLLAGGWGLAFAFGLCSLGVFVCLFVCVRVGVVGQCGPAALLLRLACLRAHALVWALLACAGCCVCPDLRAGCNSMGRDNVVPPHCVRWWRCLADACAGKGRGVGGGGESGSRVVDIAPPAFALAYVGMGTLLSVLNRVGVEPPAGYVLAWLGGRAG